MLQTFKATAHGIEGIAVEVNVRDFEIVMDEPEELGGTNRGMNPVEAILGALGSCQCIVAAAFADAQGFEYRDIKVEVEGDLDPDGFMGLSDVRTGLQDVRYKVIIDTDEPKEKVEQFLDFVAHTCPVEDTLSGVSCSRTEIVIA